MDKKIPTSEISLTNIVSGKRERKSPLKEARERLPAFKRDLKMEENVVAELTTQEYEGKEFLDEQEHALLTSESQESIPTILEAEASSPTASAYPEHLQGQKQVVRQETMLQDRKIPAKPSANRRNEEPVEEKAPASTSRVELDAATQQLYTHFGPILERLETELRATTIRLAQMEVNNQELVRENGNLRDQHGILRQELKDAAALINEYERLAETSDDEENKAIPEEKVDQFARIDAQEENAWNGARNAAAAIPPVKMPTEGESENRFNDTYLKNLAEQIEANILAKVKQSASSSISPSSVSPVPPMDQNLKNSTRFCQVGTVPRTAGPSNPSSHVIGQFLEHSRQESSAPSFGFAPYVYRRDPSTVRQIQLQRPKSYDGDYSKTKSATWIRDFLAVAAHNEWDPAMCLYHVRASLTGSAGLWFDRRVASQGQFNTWDEFGEEFCRSFTFQGDPHSYSQVRSIRGKPGDSWFKLRAAIDEATVNLPSVTPAYFDHHQLDVFFRAIPSAVAAMIQAFEPKTLHQAIAKAEFYFPKGIPAKESVGKSVGVATVDMAPLVNDDAVRKEKARKYKERLAKAKANISRSSEGSTLDMSKVRCYECNKMGHFARNCSIRKTRLAREANVAAVDEQEN